ncbi:MAG: DASS family sodium-coupled anion symporter [Candidatus Aenigmarchaeota archaeon]|nr:DASS family sodium-coupled anion symporter [Candidatus Aenigmarchaeota archaeon]
MRYEIHPWRILLSLFAAVFVYFLPLGFEGDAHTMLFVMVFVASLWVSEAAPFHATAVFVALLLVMLVGLKPEDVFAQYFDPVIMLLLGGFAIAVAMGKYRLDEYIAYRILGKVGSKSSMVILALILTSAFISMWISNSATAAIIMPIALVILAKNRMKPGSRFGKASVLAVGYGATIGGVGTIIGSTPNIMAAKFLNDAGVSFGFYEWFYRGFPFMIILMLAGWLALVAIFRPEKNRIVMSKQKEKMSAEQKKVLAVFVVTVFLWITENIHGIHNSVVALVPIVLFYFLGLLSIKDFLKIDWPTLVLIGGGLALGMGIHATSLDASFASVISAIATGRDSLALFLLLGLAGIVMTVVVSNTTAAAVYLPLVVALASLLGTDVTNTVVVAALAVSLDFMFPFGTPPTAIAYGTKFVNMKDIAKAGIAISFIGLLLLAFMGLLW